MHIVIIQNWTKQLHHYTCDKEMSHRTVSVVLYHTVHSFINMPRRNQGQSRLNLLCTRDWCIATGTLKTKQKRHVRFYASAHVRVFHRAKYQKCTNTTISERRKQVRLLMFSAPHEFLCFNPATTFERVRFCACLFLNKSRDDLNPWSFQMPSFFPLPIQ